MDTRGMAHLAVVCKLQYYIATNRSVDRSVNHPWSSGLSSLEYATDIHKFYKLIIYLHEGCFAAIISDVNECTSLTHDCHSDAICSNTDGAFTCSCYPGYTGDGQQCSGMFFFYITIKLYYSRFKFVLFWYQWPFTAFLFFFNYRITISVCQGNHAFKDRAFLDSEVFMKPLSWIAFLHCRTRLRASALACACLLAIFLEIQWLAKSHIFDSQQDTSNLHDLS